MSTVTGKNSQSRLIHSSQVVAAANEVVPVLIAAMSCPC